VEDDREDQMEVDAESKKRKRRESGGVDEDEPFQPAKRKYGSPFLSRTCLFIYFSVLIHLLHDVGSNVWLSSSHDSSKRPLPLFIATSVTCIDQWCF
jgi:hypothetical protein